MADKAAIHAPKDLTEALAPGSAGAPPPQDRCAKAAPPSSAMRRSAPKGRGQACLEAGVDRRPSP
jgi:hypothetical protein